MLPLLLQLSKGHVIDQVVSPCPSPNSLRKIDAGLLARTVDQVSKYIKASDEFGVALSVAAYLARNGAAAEAEAELNYILTTGSYFAAMSITMPYWAEDISEQVAGELPMVGTSLLQQAFGLSSVNPERLDVIFTEINGACTAPKVPRVSLHYERIASLWARKYADVIYIPPNSAEEKAVAAGRGYQTQASKPATGPGLPLELSRFGMNEANKQHLWPYRRRIPDWMISRIVTEFGRPTGPVFPPKERNFDAEERLLFDKGLTNEKVTYMVRSMVGYGNYPEIAQTVGLADPSLEPIEKWVLLRKVILFFTLWAEWFADHPEEAPSTLTKGKKMKTEVVKKTPAEETDDPVKKAIATLVWPQSRLRRDTPDVRGNSRRYVGGAFLIF